MKARNEKFTKIVNANNQFLIPVFQRNFSWTVEQCAQLWRDLKRTSSETEDTSHFLGPIVYIEADVRGPFQRWMLIDGQQRLTTLTVVLIALRDYIQAVNWVGSTDGPTIEKIDAYYLKNVLESGQRQYKLLLRRNDNATLQALIDQSDPADLPDGYSELLLDAYEFFLTELQNPNCDPEAVYRGICRLSVVDVTLERGVDNPQLVFESMNSTGVDLRQSDLVRNYLLMDIDETEQSLLYDKYWREIETLFQTSGNAFDNFLRDYMALKQSRVQQIRLDRVYDDFKLFYKSDGNNGLQDLLIDMTNSARSYASFLGIVRSGFPWLAESMTYMRSLNTTQSLLVMRLFEFHEQGKLTQSEFIRSVELTESYLLRRAVVGLQTRGYWALFARIALNLNPDSVFDSLQVAFTRLEGNNRFPGDDEFSRAMVEHDLYGLRVCKHILDRLENAGQHEPSPVQNYSIEHVMPQKVTDVPEWQEMLGVGWESIHETWLHRLGNLTLTAYNSTYSNRPFHEKVALPGGFSQSAVRLNEDIRSKSQWTREEMQCRGNKLAQRALSIWPRPVADIATIQAADIRDLTERAAENDPNELEMSDSVRYLLNEVLTSIQDMGNVINVVENKSVSCYSPEFFVELMPRAHRLRVILPLELDEVEIHDGLAVYDASAQKFVVNRVHTDSDLLVDIEESSQISTLLPLIRQAFNR
ncbi:MAG: DUF262 domain-containing protein [Gammaproteobacteria bacterium]|nr:DUF262 domain-containing protein [Gammaproteobacteria bacterium]